MKRLFGMQPNVEIEEGLRQDETYSSVVEEKTVKQLLKLLHCL